MKITIEDNEGKVCQFTLPEWAEERRLLILGGVELIAEKVPWNDYIEVKRERCNNCGQCCMTLTPDSMQTPFGVDDEGMCKALKNEGDKWVCGAGVKKPYSCLADPLKENTPECSIIREKIELK